MLRKMMMGLALGAMAAAAPFLAAGTMAQPRPGGSITLYNEEGFAGAGVTVTRDVPDLSAVPAAEGFDGSANDYAFSLRTQGRWEVCMDAGFTTACVEVEGEVAALGDKGGSISSVRYLGPSATGVGRGRTASAAPAPAQGMAADDWQPMRDVDLFGGDYRAIIYERAGSTWQQCNAACAADPECKAFTYVRPGRTEHGECFLKNAVPEPAQSDCCISGIKGAPSAGTATGDEAIGRVLSRLGQTAGTAIEDEANAALERRLRGLIGTIAD